MVTRRTTKGSPLSWNEMDANLSEIEANAEAILTKTDTSSFVAGQTTLATVQSQVTALTQTVNSKLSATGGVLTGPVQLQSSQAISATGPDLARLDTVDAKIAAAVAAIPIVPPDPTGAPTTATQPVIRVQGGGPATVGCTLEIQTAGTFNGTPDSTTRLWKANGLAPAGTATNTTYVTLASDVGKVMTLLYTAIKATYNNVTNTSNGIQILASSLPVLLTAPTLTESPAGTFTIVDGVWDQSVTKSYEVYVNNVVVKTGSTANTYVSVTADTGKPIFIRTLPSFGGTPLTYVDTPTMTVSGAYYVPNTGVAVPTAAPAPDVPGTITVTDLGNNSYGLTTTFDNSPNGLLDWYWDTSSSGTALTNNYIGASPGTSVSVLFNNPSSAVYVRVKSRNSTGSSAYSAYTQLVTQTPPTTISPLTWGDSRIDAWVRTSKTNQQISDAANGWMGSQMAIEGDFDSSISDPHTQPDSLNGNAQRLVHGRGGAGTADEGWFKHRTFDGMPPWNGTRCRSTVKGPLRFGTGWPSNGIYQGFELGKTYWFGTGWKLYDDIFSQTSSSEDAGTSILEFHAWADGPNNVLLSGQQPLAFYAGQNSYWGRCLWNGSAQNLTTAPTGYTGVANEREGPWHRVTIASSSKAAAVGIPHFYAFKFFFHWDYNNATKPYITVYRQIGVDGTIVQLGSWTIPTTYYDPDFAHSTFVQMGIHRWYVPQGGATTRSIDYAGYIVVEDDGTITAQKIFDSVTADIPRASSSGGGGSSSTIAVDFTTAKKVVSIAPNTTDTQTHTSNFTAGKTAIMVIAQYQSANNRITGVTIGGTAATLDAQTPSPTGQFVLETWRATNMAGGTANIAVSVGAGPNNHAVSYAVTQVDALSLTPVDTPTKAYATGTNTAPAISMGSVAAQANEIAFAGFTWEDTLTAAITAPSGWTETVQHTNGTTEIPIGAAYKILSSTAIDTATWTIASAGTWYSSIVTYKAA